MGMWESQIRIVIQTSYSDEGFNRTQKQNHINSVIERVTEDYHVLPAEVEFTSIYYTPDSDEMVSTNRGQGGWFKQSKRHSIASIKGARKKYRR